MRTSLNEIKKTEDFLSGAMSPEDTLLFRARLLLDPDLQQNTSLLERCYSIIRWHGRKELRKQIESVHDRVFTDPHRTTFRQNIEALFLKR